MIKREPPTFRVWCDTKGCMASTRGCDSRGEAALVAEELHWLFDVAANKQYCPNCHYRKVTERNAQGADAPIPAGVADDEPLEF